MFISGQPPRTPDGQEDHADVKGGATRVDEESMHASGDGPPSDITPFIQTVEHVAIIGLSEAGKSSLEALIQSAQERPPTCCYGCCHS
jgi:ABC-type transport system involved in cytochrome bd biosynthesis fused ATPase/permease subunit